MSKILGLVLIFWMATAALAAERNVLFELFTNTG
jgi:hypothetical protein